MVTFGDHGHIDLLQGGKMVTSDILSALAPTNKNIDIWVEAMNTILPKYDIVTPKRLAAFLAQTAHESAGFTAVRENLNYSAKGLMKTWPARFNQATAAAYARQPEKIANKVYANRMGNGDEASGDGWRYRGRGLIQTTGKANYVKLAQYIKKTLEETIEYCETVEGAVESACFYWTSNNLNAIADIGDMAALTRRINGGVIGLADRLDKYKKTLEALEKSNAKVG